MQLRKDANQALGADRGIDLDMQGLAVEIIDDVERAKAPSADQRIAHEIRRPYCIGHAQNVQRNPLPLGQPPLGRTM